MASGRCRLHSGDHSSREVGYAWLQRRNSQWQRLQAHSERALNTIAASREKREATVALFGGRWEADLKLWDDINGHCGLGVVGSITSRYGEGPALPLARTRWCYRRGGGKWSPFSASHDALLEETFRALLVSAATKAAVQHQGSLAQRVVSSVVEVKTADEGAYTVTLECDVRSGSVDAWMKAEDGGWVSRACYISRGWAGERLPQLSAEELAVEQAPCSALVLVIHGAGESFWRRRPGRLRGLCESVGKLRANAAAAVAQGMKQQGTPARRVEFLGIEWSQAIRGRRREGRDESRASSLLDPTSRLSRVSLASVPLLREFANEVILDVLFYEQAAHRQRIQRAVLDGIRALVVEWHRHNPSFAADGGRVVLLGHSLGALTTHRAGHAPPFMPPDERLLNASAHAAHLHLYLHPVTAPYTCTTKPTYTYTLYLHPIPTIQTYTYTYTSSRSALRRAAPLVCAGALICFDLLTLGAVHSPLQGSCDQTLLRSAQLPSSDVRSPLAHRLTLRLLRPWFPYRLLRLLARRSSRPFVRAAPLPASLQPLPPA